MKPKHPNAIQASMYQRCLDLITEVTEFASEIKPEIETARFFVLYHPSYTYTALGASNIHHAANKASKLYKGKWTGLTSIQPIGAWRYLDVKEFGKHLKQQD